MNELSSFTRPSTTERGIRSGTETPVWCNPMKFSSLDLDGTTVRSNVQEFDDYYEFSVDMPGVGRDNISVTLREDNILVVQTSYEESNDKVTKKRHYKKSVKLTHTDKIDVDNIEASYVDGVLSVSLPKVSKKQRTTRQIEVQ